MGAAENKAVLLRFWEEVMNQRKLDVLDEIVSPAIVDHGAFPGQPPGIEGIRQTVSAFLSGSSDLHYDLLATIAEEDLVVTHWRGRGTHDGHWLGADPTGKQVTGTGIGIDRIENGRIVESWNEFDTAAFATQLGLQPTPWQSS